MGVLNCTPDSFSDGGLHATIKAAVAHGLRLWRQGAAIVDVGGESTRPGAQAVDVHVEIKRVVPVIRELTAADVVVSVDTSKAEVMRQALAAGATMVNDVTALTGDPEALAVIADYACDVCLMHMQGTPASMQQNPFYQDVVAEVEAYLARRIEACLAAGVAEEAIVIDPGIGFGKRLEDNLKLLAAIPRLRRLGFPVLIGASRKSFLGQLTGAPVQQREIETAAVSAICTFTGVDGLRVHDVGRQKRAAQVASALRNALPDTGKAA